MLASLFGRLTAHPERGAALFAALTERAREPHWYIEGRLPDTIDGRFAVLATVTALALVRLEQGGEPGNDVSVGLTERFIQVMESEHRELGLGDPTLGRQVRKLVGLLGRRVELWRNAIALDQWNEAARQSLYKQAVSSGALLHSADALRSLWSGLSEAEVHSLGQGRLG